MARDGEAAVVAGGKGAGLTAFSIELSVEKIRSLYRSAWLISSSSSASSTSSSTSLSKTLISSNFYLRLIPI